MKRLLAPALLLALALPASAATLHNEFLFDTGFADSQGNGTASGAGTVAGGEYALALGNGLNVQFGAMLNTWSVVLRADLDDLDQWKRVMATEGNTSDEGLYFYYGALTYFSAMGTTSYTIAPDRDFTLAVVFDGAQSLFYLDGALRFALAVNSNMATPHAASGLKFFDDLGYPEEGPGSLDYLRVYDGALTAQEAEAMTSAVPLPAPAGLLAAGLAGLAALRSRRG